MSEGKKEITEFPIFRPDENTVLGLTVLASNVQPGTTRVFVDKVRYDKAIEALKEFAKGESQFMDGVECMHLARTTLRELGEYE